MIFLAANPAGNYPNDGVFRCGHISHPFEPFGKGGYIEALQELSWMLISEEGKHTDACVTELFKV